jgi:hypothetical protein
MAIISISWAQHLAGIAADNNANKNMRAFTKALDPSKTTTEQCNALVEDVDATVLLLGPGNLVQRIHSWTKFSGTRVRPKISIACLVGLEPGAMLVKNDKSQVVALQTVLIPPASEISACKTINDFIRLTATTITSDEEAIKTATPTKETPASTTALSTGTKTPANATATNPQGRTTHQSTGAAREAAGSRSNDATNSIRETERHHAPPRDKEATRVNQGPMQYKQEAVGQGTQGQQRQ